jgi:hypothetical protein
MMIFGCANLGHGTLVKFAGKVVIMFSAGRVGWLWLRGGV